MRNHLYRNLAHLYSTQTPNNILPDMDWNTYFSLVDYFKKNLNFSEVHATVIDVVILKGLGLW